MQIRILTSDDVKTALPMAKAIEIMKHAFGQLSNGKATVPLRLKVSSDKGDTLLMPAYLHSSQDLGIKIISFYKDNALKGIPTVTAIVIVLDPQTGQYFYHFFFPEQPDLNWRNPVVKEAMFDAVRFWLERGVDGFRLDAISCIYETEGFPDCGVDDSLAQLFLDQRRGMFEAGGWEAYRQKLSAQVEEQKARVDQFKAKAKGKAAQARIEAEEQIGLIEQQIDAARAQLAKLAEASEDAWEDLKDDVEKAWNDLSKTAKGFFSKFTG